ncbi:MAG TPA: family 20 glycosylhydrolase [Chitinophagaceae bacterium]|nr:family 20 glycosylhydrolase [Chitinophagaceae bacterium]
MKISTLALAILLQVGSAIVVTAQEQETNLGIIPAPAHINIRAGYFIINHSTLIKADGNAATHCATLLNDYLQKNYGYTLSVRPASYPSHGARVIRFALRPKLTVPEGYRLHCSPGIIQVESSGGAGLFYGLQSLIQMIDAATRVLPDNQPIVIQVPCVDINDYPRFSYRGMHLDCCRHFFPLSFIKEYLDLMARYKINTFHWHLTDDQGWRIQIKKYPLLTQVGAYRKQTLVGHAGSGKYDGIPYGGYYTQRQIRDIVQYAHERYITVLPEIEMPGHSQAALTAYPYLGCTGGPYAVATSWGVFPDIYCAGKDSTFDFLENVLREVMKLFPSHYIHIGGDEVPKVRWEQDPRDLARMKSLGLTSADQLQSYFIQRIEKFLNAHGRAIIGWDEILEGGLAPNATVMSWRGEAGGIAAAEQHHDVIMTPGNWVYFDHGQGDPSREPLNIGGYLPLSKVYSYDPVPAALPDSERKYILGVQANVWSEYIATVRKAEYMILPRMLALAEIAWTPLDKKNYPDFLSRLPSHLARLDREHIFFRIPEPAGLSNQITTQDKLMVKLIPYVPGTRMHYAIGDTVTLSSPVYTHPLELNLALDQPDTLNVLEVTPSGNTSVMYSAVYKRQAFHKSLPYTPGPGGLRFSLYHQPVFRMSSLDSLAADSSGIVDSISLKNLGNSMHTIGMFTGMIRIDGSGIYRFVATTSGRVDLFIDGTEIISNDQRDAEQSTEGMIPLLAGYHRISLKYMGYGKEQYLQVNFGLKNGPLQSMNPGMLFH